MSEPEKWQWQQKRQNLWYTKSYFSCNCNYFLELSAYGNRVYNKCYMCNAYTLYKTVFYKPSHAWKTDNY